MALISLDMCKMIGLSSLLSSHINLVSLSRELKFLLMHAIFVKIASLMSLCAEHVIRACFSSSISLISHLLHILLFRSIFECRPISINRLCALQLTLSSRSRYVPCPPCPTTTSWQALRGSPGAIWSMLVRMLYFMWFEKRTVSVQR